MKKSLAIFALLFPLTVLADSQPNNPAGEVSKHYAATPNLYDLDNSSAEQLSDKITRQYVMGSESMLVKWTLKKGAVIPNHLHKNEQITWITKGSVKVVSQGKEYIVKAGGVFIIPPFVPHEFTALEDTIDMDFFTPVREDWLNGTAGYIQAIKK